MSGSQQHVRPEQPDLFGFLLDFCWISEWQKPTKKKDPNKILTEIFNILDLISIYFIFGSLCHKDPLTSIQFQFGFYADRPKIARPSPTWEAAVASVDADGMIAWW